MVRKKKPVLDIPRNTQAFIDLSKLAGDDRQAVGITDYDLEQALEQSATN